MSTAVQPLFCLLFFSLQVGSSSDVNALSHYGVFGENISIPCSFLSSGAVKMFCRETCEGENLLIRTTNDTAQIGRYRSEYVREASKTYTVLSVSISELTWSDSGRYSCGLGDSSSSASYYNLNLFVVDDLLDGNKDHHLYKEAGSSLIVACSFGSSGRTNFFCRGECEDEEVLVQTDGVRAESGKYSIGYDKGHKSRGVLLVSITNLTQSDSGRYRCKMDRTFLPDLHRDFNITVTEGSRQTSADILLIIRLTVGVPLILLSGTLLVFCGKRSTKTQKVGEQENFYSHGFNMEDVIIQNHSPPDRHQNQVYFTTSKPT